MFVLFVLLCIAVWFLGFISLRGRALKCWVLSKERFNQFLLGSESADFKTTAQGLRSLAQKSARPPLLQDIDNLQRICESCGVKCPDLGNVMIPGLAVFNEIVLLSLLTDKQLPNAEKKKRIEARYKKVEASERVFGKIMPCVHNLIRTEAAGVVTGVV